MVTYAEVQRTTEAGGLWPNCPAYPTLPPVTITPTFSLTPNPPGFIRPTGVPSPTHLPTATLYLRYPAASGETLQHVDGSV